MRLSRFSALLAAAWLAGCAGGGAPRTYPPLRYGYLTPLRLNVASIDYAPLPPPSPLDLVSPVPAADALRQLAQDRLSAAGSSGTALVKIGEARIAESGGGLDGTFALEVDVMTSGGERAGFAEARVVRRVEPVGDDLRAAVYDMTKQMLDDMNIELEFQMRKSLRDYLQTTSTAPEPAPVEQQDLAPPPP